MDTRKGTLWWELTALWAFVEVTLGGFLHALRIPLTGIVVGGSAVAIISVLGFYSTNPFKTIIKSTLIVMIVKAGASPHAPLPAYLAVSFQGFVGATLFFFFRYHKIASVLFAIICMLESALQKLLLLTIMYGMALWEAIDVFIKKTSWQFYSGNYNISLWIAATYVFFYGAWGLYIGIRMSNFPQRINQLREKYKEPDGNIDKNLNLFRVNRNYLFWVIYIMTLAFMVSVLVVLDDDKHNIAYILIRSFAALGLIFLVINPIFKKLVAKKARLSQNAQLVQDILSSLNTLRNEYYFYLKQLPRQLIVIKYFKAVELLIAFRIKNIEKTIEK